MSDLNFGIGLQVDGLPETNQGVQAIGDGLQTASDKAKEFTQSTADGLVKLRGLAGGLTDDIRGMFSRFRVPSMSGSGISASHQSLRLSVQSLTVNAQSVIVRGESDNAPKLRDPAEAKGQTYGFAPEGITGKTYGFKDDNNRVSLGKSFAESLNNQAKADEREKRRQPKLADSGGLLGSKSLRVDVMNVESRRTVINGGQQDQRSQSGPVRTNQSDGIGAQLLAIAERMKQWSGKAYQWLSDTNIELPKLRLPDLSNFGVVGRGLSSVVNDFKTDFGNAGKELKKQFGIKMPNIGSSVLSPLMSRFARFDWALKSGLAAGTRSVLGAFKSVFGGLFSADASNVVNRPGDDEEEGGKKKKSRLRRLVGAASTVAAGGVGLAAMGFGGTVEMARFQNEVRYLGIELASALKPFLVWATDATRSVRRWIEGLDATQQKLLGWGLALGAGVKTLSLLGGLAGPIVGLVSILKNVPGLGLVNRLVGGVAGGAGAAGNVAGAGANAAGQVAAKGANVVAQVAPEAAGKAPGLLGRIGNFAKGGLRVGARFAGRALAAFQVIEAVRANEQEKDVADKINKIRGGREVDKDTAEMVNANIAELKKQGPDAIAEFRKRAEKERRDFAMAAEGVDENGKIVGGGARAQAELNRGDWVLGLNKEFGELRKRVQNQQLVVAGLDAPGGKGAKAAGQDKNKEKVTFAQSGFGAIGSTFEELQTEFLKLQSDEAKKKQEEGVKEDPVVLVLKEIRDRLPEKGNAGAAPDKRPAQ